MEQKKQATVNGMTTGPWSCDHCEYTSEDRNHDDYGVSWYLPRGSVVCPGCWGEFYEYLYEHHRDLHAAEPLSPEKEMHMRKVSAQWIADTKMAQPNPRMEAGRRAAEALMRQ